MQANCTCTSTIGKVTIIMHRASFITGFGNVCASNGYVSACCQFSIQQLLVAAAVNKRKQNNKKNYTSKPFLMS